MDIRVGIVQEFTIARTSTPGYLWKVFGFVRQHPSKSLLLCFLWAATLSLEVVLMVVMLMPFCYHFFISSHICYIVIMK